MKIPAEPFNLPDFLQTVTVDGAKVIGRFTFPPHFIGFSGHFPGQPVLPAVVQLAAVRYLACLGFGYNLVPGTIERVKFSRPVIPDENMAISLQQEREDRSTCISFTIATDHGQSAVGEMTCHVLDKD